MKKTVLIAFIISGIFFISCKKSPVKPNDQKAKTHLIDSLIIYKTDNLIIKKLKASKGNLEDANTAEWSQTVRKIKTKYPKAKIVIPGHGKWGDFKLFDYTIDLFKQQGEIK